MRSLSLAIIALLSFLSSNAQSFNMCSTASSNSASGTFYDSGGQFGNHNNNENCTFLISPTGCVSNLSMSFTSMSLESCCDRLRIYDGTSASAPLIGTYTGNSLPPTINSTSGSLFFRFTSDGSVVRSGWAATWAATVTTANPVADFTISDNNPPLSSEVTFTDATSNNPLSWNWSFGNGMGSTLQNPNNTYTSPGTYRVNLNATNCVSSDTVSKLVTVQPAPQIGTNPSTLTDTANCADTVFASLVVRNTGSGDMVLNSSFSVNTSNGGDLKVLAYTTGVDYFGEYTNTINSIARLSSNYTLTEVNTFSGSVLRDSLVGKDVLLIAEIENGNTFHYSSISPEIEAFARNGGTVIFCGTGSARNGLLFEPGIFTGSNAGGSSSAALNRTNPAHPLADSTFGPFFATSFTTFLDITNPGAVMVFDAFGRDAVTYLSYGTGDYIYLGFDYFVTNPFQDRLLANALKMARSNGVSSSTANTDTISRNDSITLNFSIPLGNTLAGTYTDTIFLNSNDPTNPLVSVPFTYVVAGSPAVGLSQSAYNFGSHMIGSVIPDTLIVDNSGCDSLIFDSLVTNGNQFLINPNTSSIAPFSQDTVFISFQPSLIQPIVDTLRIYSNGGLDLVSLQGIGLGAPSISYQPTAITDTIFSCDDSLIIPIQINNSGSGTLQIQMNVVDQNATGVGAGLVFFDGFESGINYSNWLIVNAGNTFSQVSTNPASGNFCLGIRGSAPRALMYQFTPDTISEFSFKLRTDATVTGNTNYIAIGNAIDEFGIASVRYIGSGQYEISSGSPAIQYTTVNSWTHFELKNVNYNTHRFDLYVDGSLFASQLFFDNSFLADASRVNLISFNNSFTSYYDDIRIGGSGVSEWALLSADSVNVPIGDSTTFNLRLLSGGLSNGTYSSEVVLNSNDPLRPLDTIPVSLTVIGQPEIALGSICFNHPSTQQFSTSKDSVRLYNPGCDTLVISSITSNSTEFSPRSSSLNLAPGDSTWLFVDFAPTGVGTSTGQLTLLNNATDTVICLSANSIGAPVISHFPNNINATIRNCDDSVTIPLLVINRGLNPMQWNLGGTDQLDDDFESGINPGKWTINGGFPSGNCGTVSGSSALYFNGSSVRTATTRVLNTNDGGTIDFHLKFGTAGGSCERADIGEDVVLEYSTNNGSSWNVINTYVTTSFPVFTAVNEPIPNVARNANTRFRWRQLSFSGSGFDHWAIDDVRINSGGVAGFITNASPDSGLVNAGDTTTILLTISSRDLISGFYSDFLVISSNDPVTPFDTIPVNLDYLGRPEIGLSRACLNYGSQFVNSVNVDSMEIYNSGCDTLTISNAIPLSSAYTVISRPDTLFPGDTGRIVVEFNPTSIGNFNSLVRVFNNDRDTSICLTGNSTPAPIILQNPASFNLSMSACDSVDLPMVIRNIGGSNLNFNLDSTNGSASRMEVLALTYGVDYFDEYTNTIAAINRHFTNYNLTEVNTTNSVTLSNALANKDLLLIAETETGSPFVFSGFATVLQNFVNNGGSVVFCGADQSDALCMFNTGLFSGNGLGNFVGSMNVVNPSHPITSGVSASPSTQSATFSYNLTNSNVVDLVTYLGNSVVSYRNLGSGKVVLVGYDFFNNANLDASRMIANAVQWAGSSSLPSWLSLSANNGTVTPTDSTVIDVSFNAKGLSPGTYTGSITVNSNDPANPNILVPCTLTVTFAPCADFEYTKPNPCGGAVAFGDSSINNPTIWSWDFGDGNGSSIQHPRHTYASAGIYNVRLITTNAFGTDTVVKPVPVNIMEANFSAVPPYVTNSPIQFNSNAPGAISWFWDFGDGGSSSSANPSHTYAASGQYVVSLITINGQSCSDIKRDTLNVLLVGLEDQVSAESFVVYPNPNQGRFMIQNHSALKLNRITVYDAKGQLIDDRSINLMPSTEQKIELNEVAAGIYLINLEFEDGSSIQKKFMID